MDFSTQVSHDVHPWRLNCHRNELIISCQLIDIVMCCLCGINKAWLEILGDKFILLFPRIREIYSENNKIRDLDIVVCTLIYYNLGSVSWGKLVVIPRYLYNYEWVIFPNVESITLQRNVGPYIFFKSTWSQPSVFFPVSSSTLKALMSTIADILCFY